MPPAIDWDFLLHDNHKTVFDMLSEMVLTMTYEEIAKKLGVHRETILRKIHEMKIFNPKSDPKVKRNYVLARGGGRRNSIKEVQK
jgi:hypothetical protein